MYECYYWGNMTNPAYPIKDTTIALARMELAANFFIPVPGPKMIWMFGELGYDYSINFNDRVGVKPIRWDYFSNPSRKRLYQVYSALNGLKGTSEAFSTNDYRIAFQDTVKKIHLNHSSMNVAILGNFGIRASSTDPDFQHAGWWYEYWTGDSVDIDDVHGRIRLQPGEYRLYTDVRLKRPDLISGTGGAADYAFGSGELFVYPNPAVDRLFVRFSGRLLRGESIRVIDLQGRQVLMRNDRFVTGSGDFELDVRSLEPGIYFIELLTTEGRKVARWIK